MTEARALVPTSFGPEEDESTVMHNRMIVKKMKESQRQDLTN